jgi:release factor glutamine methyltransferase
VAADEEAVELVAAAADPDHLDRMVARRRAGEPLAWITGTARFCGLDVAVAPGVYVPRWQSQTLARTAARHLPARGVAVDLCTGSGAVAMVLRAEHPGATVIATEIDPIAAACARGNAVDVRIGDLDGPLPGELAGRVDVMTGVPPYVPGDAFDLLPRDVREFEPVLALDGGHDGLAVVARMVACSTRWMAPGGRLLVEVGGGQFDGVAGMLTAAGYDTIEVLSDGDGDPRAVCGRFAHLVGGRPAVQASSR